MKRPTLSVLALIALLCAACTGGARLSDPVEGTAVPVDDNSFTYPDCKADEEAAIDPVAL